jgi:hypothetical protein
MATLLQAIGLLLIAVGVYINFGAGWAFTAAGIEAVLVGIAHELRPRKASA